MEPRELEGFASASEVPVRAPGSEYNFRPRSRSATTVPKDRRLGSVETKGAGSTLERCHVQLSQISHRSTMPPRMRRQQ